jgi:rod shape determining protein RodA
MKRELWKHFDFWLFGAVVLLSIFGIVMIRSAIAGNEVLVEQVNRQVIYVAVGIVVMLVVSLVDYHYWASLSRLMYVVIILLLFITFIVGVASFGATRWIQAGLVNIQPSELAKIIMIIVLADWFNRHKDEVKDLRWVFRSLVVIGLVVIWIILQPNLSNTIVLMVLWFALIWLSGLPVKYILLFAAAGIFLAVVAFPFLEPYQQQRVIQFAFPDPNARHGNSYNVDQALVTIGSGGLAGQGLGHASQVQNRFLQVRHTDYIFSAMAAEFGFIGTVVIIGTLLFIIFRCLRAVRLASDFYGSLLCFGVAVLLTFQTAVNIGVNLNLIPVTGLTLPFISYGGSSILSLVIGIGLVESVVARHKSLEF